MRQKWILLYLLLPLLLALAACAGAPFIALRHWWTPGSEQLILLQLRLPRVLMAFIAGGGLAVAGMMYQALFRNPLATPYTLGLASGASLGAAFVALSGFAGIFAAGWGAAGAMLGALAVMGVVLAAGKAAGGLTRHSLLLAGVAMNFICGSLVMLAQYLADYTQAFRLLRWLMGSISSPGVTELAATSVLVLASALPLLLRHRELDLLSTGEELALSRGVDVRRERRLLLGSSAVLVGAIVAVCGPIAFVGMMVPHMLRLLLGPRHSRLGIWVFPVGGLFLVCCDTLARSLLAPAEMPVGILTALLGGPFFLFLLIRGRV